MSDIQAHHTQIAKAAAGTGQAAPALNGGTGVFGLGSGAAFWDLILTQFKPASGEQGTMKTPATPVAKTDSAPPTLLSEEELELMAEIDEALLVLLEGEAGEDEENEGERPLSLLNLLRTMRADDEHAPIDIPATRIERLHKKIAVFEKLVEKLTAGLPLEARGDERIDALIERLEKQTELLRTGKINQEEVPLVLFIALGLSPAQITQVTAKIEKVEEKLGRELTVEDIIAGVGGILPADEPAAGKTTEQARPGLASAGIPAETGDLRGAAQSARHPGVANASSHAGDGRSGYQRLEEMTRTAPAPVQPAETLMAAGAKQTTAAPALAPVLPANQTMPGGTLLTPSWQATFIETPGAIEFDIRTGLPLTQAAQAAHTATSSAQAGQSHPGTQMLATILTRMAKDGAAREMTIQMDPPELGRVLAKLQFGKDQSVKAMLLVEKPETYTMLLRDAASLERALQNAGLTMDSASLSFELAQDGSAFNSDNNGQGGGEPSGGRLSQDADAQDIIETTMTWQVDPDTGYIRYNLLA